MAKTEGSFGGWQRPIAAGVLAAFVPVLLMSASEGWLSWSIATTGVLLILTALGALILTTGGGSP